MSECPKVGAFVGRFARNLHVWLNFAVGKVRQELHKLLTGDNLTAVMKIVCNKNGKTFRIIRFPESVYRLVLKKQHNVSGTGCVPDLR
jgi:hypothetical protein